MIHLGVRPLPVLLLAVVLVHDELLLVGLKKCNVEMF
jgi:hypothetical protein